MFEELYKQLFENFEIISFEKGNSDGTDIITFVYKLSSNGVEMTQNQKMFFTDDATVAITYMSVSGDYDEAFEQSAQTIKVIPSETVEEAAAEAAE